MGCRSLSKCENARDLITKAYPAADVVVMELDLSSFASIRSFAEIINTNYLSIDVLINNAGVMAIPTRTTTVDGLETQVGTNHFGHFLLTGLLFDTLNNGKTHGNNGVIINHSSGAHIFASNNFVNDLMAEKYYDPWVTYGNSKAANLLFTYELNKRINKHNHSNSNRINVISIAVHPGYSATNLQAGKFPFWEYLNSMLAMPAEYGAQAQTLSAIANSNSSQGDENSNGIVASHNDYVGPRFSMFGPARVQSTDKRTWNSQLQQTLWEKSVDIVGIDFGGI